MGEIESPKAVSVLYSPLDCVVEEINEELEDDFSVINKDADNTSMFKVSLKDEADMENLLNKEQYDEYLATLK